VPRIRFSTTALAVVALAAVGFLLRVANFEDVFTSKGVAFVEFDPYYHMWRVFQTLRAYPWVPLFDPSMNTPQGATIIWPPLFDFFVATVSFLLGRGPEDVDAVETISAFVPPVLGALTVVAVYFLGRAVLDHTRALLGAALLATIPAHIWYSRLGFVDHHVAVTLVQVLMFHALLRAVAAWSDEAARPRTRWLWTAAVALWLTAGFLIWNGFLFFAALLDLCLLALLYLDRADPRSPVWRIALVSHAAAAALITPFVVATVRVSGRAFSPLTLSWLPVAALLAFALLAGLEGLRRSPRVAGWPPAARWTLVLVPVAGLAAILLYQSQNVALGLQWLTASDRFMSSVAESGSSLITAGVFDLKQPQIWLTRFYLAMPVALGLLAFDLYRTGWRDRPRTVLLIWGTVLFGMSVVQRRFGEPFAPVLALLAADLVLRIHAWAMQVFRPEAESEDRKEKRRAERDKARKPAAAPASDISPEAQARFVAGAIVAAVLVVAYFPSAPGFLQGLRADGAYSRETFDDFTRLAGVLPSRPGAARGVPRDRGVLAPWDMGHRILYLTGSPVVATNFGLHIGEDSFRAPAAFFLETDENRAVAALDQRKVSYVVSDWDIGIAQQLVTHVGADGTRYFAPLPGGEAGTMMTPAFAETVYFRMGSSYAGSQGVAQYPDGKSVPIPALEQLRLIQETSAPQARRRTRVYERVAGARILVTGAPGNALQLRYVFRLPGGREAVYRRVVPLQGGSATIRVPYSSERPEYGHSARYMIRAEDSTEAGLLVSEASVLSGRTIPLAWRPPR
jgi:dolichyl-phosphooligosaccharide-protein glycotransferase